MKTKKVIKSIEKITEEAQIYTSNKLMNAFVNLILIKKICMYAINIIK